MKSVALSVMKSVALSVIRCAWHCPSSDVRGTVRPEQRGTVRPEQRGTLLRRHSSVRLTGVYPIIYSLSSLVLSSFPLFSRSPGQARTDKDGQGRHTHHFSETRALWPCSVHPLSAVRDQYSGVDQRVYAGEEDVRQGGYAGRHAG